ncbi:RhoGAP domain [Yersinia mollaretii]|uniref:RhoGAP domain-containing protein n=1 Tax=Yersinia mollaretii TaxID=33060 RepID=UPI0005DF73CB|nr:RhoGAP domain-containing protein [Yersinia mollaretii]CNK33195.1 RhoGAP domain [Yersinia mollaretii]
MKIYEGQKHCFYNLSKPYYKDSYSIKDLDKHYNKNALLGKFSEIKNTADTIRTHSDCTVIDLKSSNISTNHIAMEKKNLASLIKSIGPIRSFIKWITSYTKVENKVPKNENALGNLTRLIHCTLSNELFFAKEGIFRESSTPAAKDRVQEALNSNNDEQITALLEEPETLNAVAAKIKENLGLALSDADKNNFHEMVVFYDLAARNDKKEYLPKISELPSPLQQLMPLLAKTADNAKENRMDATNLAIVIMPRIQPERAVNHAIPLAELMNNELVKTEAYKSFLSDLINDYDK